MLANQAHGPLGVEQGERLNARIVDAMRRTQAVFEADHRDPLRHKVVRRVYDVRPPIERTITAAGANNDRAACPFSGRRQVDAQRRAPRLMRMLALGSTISGGALSTNLGGLPGQSGIGWGVPSPRSLRKACSLGVPSEGAVDFSWASKTPQQVQKARQVAINRFTSSLRTELCELFQRS